MTRRSVTIIRLLLLATLLLLSTVPIAAQPPTQPSTVPAYPQRGLPPGIEEVPDEIRNALNGMSVEDFVVQAMERGERIPAALESLVDREVAVIVELEMPPLASVYAERAQQGITTSSARQRMHLNQLDSVQNSLQAQMELLEARVISRYQKAYSGFLTRVPANRLAEIRALPGVRAVHPAPIHYPMLAASVPLIGADDVWNIEGVTGAGITIAIIDTGIDYTHAALGGSGDPADYAANDPNIIEPGTFPTAKVIGGWDFAGPTYNAGNPDLWTPQPDPDPLDVNGHGTHVASTAAGVSSGAVGPGVAPDALLYALKVFGDVTGSTDLTIDAIEWALDPNGDGNMDDRVDVINMSLGSPFGLPYDASAVAADNAAALGVVVVASAGNSGDVRYITGSPAVADRVISVAASTTGHATLPTVQVGVHTVFYQPNGFTDGSGRFDEAVTADLQVAGTLMCNIDVSGYDPGAFTGRIVLIERGICPFVEKTNNAASLGATAVLIYNNVPNERMSMGGIGAFIPAGFLARADGLLLADQAGQQATISAQEDVISGPDPYGVADVIASFSSRGPRAYDAALKPDVTAPGVAIFAAKVGAGTGGVSMNGTSMAAPHVAGLAALIREHNPDWTPEQVKAAMMNTAVDMAQATPMSRAGIGRVNAPAAVTAGALAIGDEGLISLNLGMQVVDSATLVVTRTVTLHNILHVQRTFDVSAALAAPSVTNGVNVTANPASVSVPGNDSTTVNLTLTFAAADLPNALRTVEEVYGHVVFNDDDPTTMETLRVPFYAQPRPAGLLDITGESTIDPMGFRASSFEIEHTGPVAPSGMRIYPALMVEEIDAGIHPSASIRMVGMDYFGYHMAHGDLLVIAIAAHGHWPTPQPYFAEFDMCLDVDGDGQDDYVLFNWNLGRVYGGGNDDQWVVAQVDLHTSAVYLGSPFFINTDGNSSLMEWYIPMDWIDLDQLPPEYDPMANTSFTYWFYTLDGLENWSFTSTGEFDVQRLPFGWNLSNTINLSNRQADGLVWIDSPEGYQLSQPKGLMIIDHTGDPRNAGGQYQAYFLPLEGQYRLYLPMIMRSYAKP